MSTTIWGYHVPSKQESAQKTQSRKFQREWPSLNQVLSEHWSCTMISVINRWLSPSPAHCFGLDCSGCLFCFFWSLSLLTPQTFYCQKNLYFRSYNKGNSIFPVLLQRPSGLVTWHCNRYCSATAIWNTHMGMCLLTSIWRMTMDLVHMKCNMVEFILL